MNSPVPDLLKAPFPICHLQMWLTNVLRYARVKEQLEQAVVCFDLYDSKLRNAMLWGSFAARDSASQAMASILGNGLLLRMVPGSPEWNAAAEVAA